MTDEFSLNDAERNSLLWVKLERHFEERLQILRQRNDNHMTDQERYDLVGQIRQVKGFIALGKDPESI